eukprot:CAMPEP_0197831540 /NCGR_PEP_ID=MMETSP1437-20131217/10750_1 /TAXON_ID=49252 ORGANISM="Eucampia antarctica, Strain CCMP1452" /NCGR_SAMPLE_ID=MMETSP1437 /ASSEMBLY_ACC=CAM_ASM_001096 /LENGTH=177 /DNA_ID=CAMNT_0043434495 /DNA_START=40 /DNA_END=573 /DNA_ORIENTATION=+
MGKQDKPEMPSSFMKFSSDDCDRPACDDTISALSAALERVNNNKKSKQNQTSIIECPPSKAIIGSSAWTLLHSMSAWYPDKPTDREQEKMKNFISALAAFYPCSWCAHDFRENLKSEPVKTTNRKDLCMWMCEQHNIVNEKLGKSIFKCNMNDLDARWRKSEDDRCSGMKSDEGNSQ